jgi:hypothetical protein
MRETQIEEHEKLLEEANQQTLGITTKLNDLKKEDQRNTSHTMISERLEQL